MEILLDGFYTSCMLVGIRPETEAETTRRVSREAKEAAKQAKFVTVQHKSNARDQIVESIQDADLQYDDVLACWEEVMQARLAKDLD